MDERLIDVFEVRMMIQRVRERCGELGGLIESKCFAELAKTPVAITFPKNPTNGDMIMGMFSSAKTKTISCNGIRLYIDNAEQTVIADFTNSWWNTPYKGAEHDFG